jgi:hypothetical protein
MQKQRSAQRYLLVQELAWFYVLRYGYQHNTLVATWMTSAYCSDALYRSPLIIAPANISVLNDVVVWLGAVLSYKQVHRKQPLPLRFVLPSGGTRSISTGSQLGGQRMCVWECPIIHSNGEGEPGVVCGPQSRKVCYSATFLASGGVLRWMLGACMHGSMWRRCLIPRRHVWSVY